MTAKEIEVLTTQTPETKRGNPTSITFERINKYTQERAIYKGFIPERGWVTWTREEIAAYAREKNMKLVDQADAFYNQSIWLHA
jgi:hypothetical protein